MQDNTPVKSCQAKSVKSSTKQDDCEQIGTISPCQNRQCQHHVFHESVFNDPSNNPPGYPTHLTPHETDKSREFNNCMLQLNEGLTHRDIGEMFGIGKTGIISIVALALQHIKRNKKALMEIREYE